MVWHFQLSYRRVLSVQLFVEMWDQVEHIFRQNSCSTALGVQRVVEFPFQMDYERGGALLLYDN